jgi:hypothetical protein
MTSLSGRWSVGVLFFSCLALASAIGQTSPTSPDAGVYRVVVLGSSTAAGEYARPLDSSWVNKFKRYLGTVFNRTKWSIWLSAGSPRSM